jgi:vitamin B12 transporter
VIVSATRVEQSKQDYTGNITVITSEQLQEKSIQTLPEALDRLAGIPVYSNGGLGTATSVFLRGHDSKRILLLVDGMRFNDPTGTSGAQWQHLLVSDIERIEVLPAGTANLWGTDAAAGVINIITKKAAEGTHGSIAYTFLGDLGQKQTQGTVGYANNDFDARIGYTGLSSDEFSSITPITNGVKQNPLAYEKDGYRNDTFNAKIGLNLAQNQRIELTAFRTDSNSKFDSATANNMIPYTTLVQDSFGLSYLLNLGDWQTKIYTNKGNFNRYYQLSNTSNSKYYATNEQIGVTSDKKDSLGAWSLGADAMHQRVDNMGSGNQMGGYDQKGLFINRTLKANLFADNLPTIINFGMRNDDNNLFNSYIGKSLGVKQILPQVFYLAANVNDSRRTPSLYELSGPYTTAGMQPETLLNHEAILGWKDYSLTYFDSSIDNYIDFDFKTYKYNNLEGTSHIKGWEWKASESLPSLSSEVSANYTVLDAKTQTRTPLARRPETSGSLGWTYLGFSKTVLSLQSQFVGTRLDYTTTPTATQINPDTGNYWLWHANASYQLNKEVRLFAKVINLSDERVAQAYGSNTAVTATYYAYSPRTVLAGVEYKF